MVHDSHMTTTKHLTAARIATVRRTITTGLTTIAFLNSYSHTTNWFSNHGQAGQANFLAAIPEVAIILVVLTLAQGNMSRVTTALIGTIGVGSVTITLAANLAGASSGVAGIAAALVAPVFAILGFGLEFTSMVKVAPARKPVTRKAPATKPVKAAEAPKKRNRGVIDRGILWASEQAVWPTVIEIQTEYPTINRNTASRIHNAKPVNV